MVDTFADQRNGIKTGQGRRLRKRLPGLFLFWGPKTLTMHQEPPPMSELILYQTDDGKAQVKLRTESELAPLV
jgi:hypothetical protein